MEDRRYPTKGWNKAIRTLAVLVLFACAYAAGNYYQLVHAVLYRAAANDWYNAALQFAVLGGQALALLGAILLLPRNWFALALAVIGLSLAVNLGFSSTSSELLTAGRLGWLFVEARQADNALGEFAVTLALAAVQLVLALVLLWATRAAAGRGVRRNLPLGLVLLIVPSLLVQPLGLNPPSAERNLYSYAFRVWTADPVPQRDPVDIALVGEPSMRPRHFVWLLDESIAYAPFQRLIRPQVDIHDPLDFGAAASLGHCSGPANLALRSGVDVRNAAPGMDLRRSPSIWAYAAGAGYRTRLIEGQMAGAPQNYLLEPELELIDDYVTAVGGIDTDREIAALINKQLQDGQPTFTLAVLRGVHFQYRDHVPSGSLSGDEPKRERYETALAYSKDRFFDILLDGVDREQVAVAYLSDHGQNLEEGVLAHCSQAPHADEFRIPLLAFLPEPLAASYREAGPQGHSASQLYAATLGWMGYDRQAVEARYDNDLDKPTARYVWFDRDVIPLDAEDETGVNAGPDFPGTRR